jgi:undecaprenyl-diphosphatase
MIPKTDIMRDMTILVLQIIFLGIIEGLTEFIPVSSTAHLLLAGKIITLPQSFLEIVSISIQTGAIMAAAVFFWKKVWGNLSLVPKIIIGFLPTAIAGVLLYPYIKPLFSNTLVLALALILGGVALILIKPKETDTGIESITYKNSIIIGVMQIFSFIPGMSRSGSTLIGGTLIGIPRQEIVSFSFLLAIPTILGAGFVEILKTPTITNQDWLLILLGSFVSFVVALLSIKFFINLLTTKPLSYFGWYRIFVGILIIILL